MTREEMERQQSEYEQKIRERRAALRAEREARKKKQRQQSMIMGLAFLLILVVLVVFIFKGCGKKKNPADAGASTDSSQSESVPEGENTKEEEASAQEPSSEETEPASEEPSSEEPSSEEPSSEESSENSDDIGALETWDLDTLDTTEYNFGYSPSNRDSRNFPTDWTFYENNWGQFNVDWVQDPEQNIIYLTMDEGFPNDYTSTILDILKEKNVKATFFLTKMFLDGGEKSLNQVQRMIDEGHVIGNHTCTHPDMPSLSVEEQTQEIMGVHNIVKDNLGYDMKLFRFPEGKYSAQSLGLVDNLGYKTVFWSYAYNDYSETQPPVQESYEAAVNMLHPGAIYLLHANSSTNTAFLADWIDAAREAGYEFGVYPLARN